MINLDIAKVFNEIADIYDIKGVKWKPRAYRKAAQSIESLSKDLEAIYEKEGLKGLEEVSGVGKNMAEKIEEYIKKGKIKEHEKMKKEVPEVIEKLMQIPDIGPKTAKKLHQELKLKKVEDLKKALKKGKIKKIKGFKEKTEEEIREGLGIIEKTDKRKRYLLGVIMPIAESIKKDLEKLKEVQEIKICGSLRRVKETIRDIDLLVLTKKAKEVAEEFVSHPEVKKVLAKGSQKVSVELKEGINVDLRLITKKSWGSAVQYFTGSKLHSIHLRKIAIKKGYKLSEYGLFKGKKQVAGKTEEEIYNRLGLPYIEPELREDRGEIEAGLKKKLPQLVKLKDIKGDLQMHTKNSDGDNTIEEMAKKAKELGYQYIAVTDHVGRLKIAGSMSSEKFEKAMKEIEKVNKKIKGVRVLKGAEIDINKEGKLNVKKRELKDLEIVGAAVHSGLKMNKKEMTKRLTGCLEENQINILFHPTSRKILKREPIKVDMEKLLETAKKTKTVLEIDSLPKRLDLSDINAKAAVEKGVKLSIDTDAHSKQNLDFMRFGVGTARRGWVEKKDVINTYSLKRLRKFLEK